MDIVTSMEEFVKTLKELQKTTEEYFQILESIKHHAEKLNDTIKPQEKTT